MELTGIEGLTLAGFQAVVLVVFVVQTIIEAFPALRGRYTPLVAAVTGVVLATVMYQAPAVVADILGTGLALAASASLAVRYVKRDEAQQAQPGNGAPVIVDFGDR